MRHEYTAFIQLPHFIAQKKLDDGGNKQIGVNIEVAILFFILHVLKMLFNFTQIIGVNILMPARKEKKIAHKQSNMEQSLQEITRKLYEEGIEKAELEAAEILQNARAKADALIQDAKAEKQQLLAKAAQESDALKSRTHAELQLVINQALEKLKQDITHLINQKAVDTPIEQALQDKETLSNLLLQVIKQLFANESGQINIHIAPTQDESLSRYIGMRISSALNEAPIIKPDKNMQAGFKIGKTGQNYVISFTDEDFKIYIGSFMHPEIAKIFKSND